MNQNALNLQSTRTRVFFWIGMLILPVFWIWWMTERYFSKTQRIVGWTWTALYVGAGVYFHEHVAAGADGIVLDYHFVALRISLALTIWLLLRISGFFQTLVYLILSVDIVAILAGLAMPAMMRNGPSPGFLIYPSVLVVAHLLLDPVRNRWRASRIYQWIQTH